MIKTISYLGLGTMGGGMASNLLRAGYDLTVWNRSAAGLIEKFAASLQSPTPVLRVAEKSRIGRCPWLRQRKRLRFNQGARKRSRRRNEGTLRELINGNGNRTFEEKVCRIIGQQ